MGADCETSIEEKDTGFRPRSQETAIIWWRFEGGIVLFDCYIDVLERRWCGSWRTDAEAQAMGLIHIVIGILAKNDGFYSMKWRMTGPEWCRVNIEHPRFRKERWKKRT